MRRLLVNILAVIGAFTVIGSLASFTLHRTVQEGSATGIVLGPDAKAAANVPVFLDRGNGVIERYTTNAAGHFSLPVKDFERRKAIWLICVPGGIPAVGRAHDDGFQIGPTTYGYGKLTQKGFALRRSGWLGPVPRECPPALDFAGWRLASELGQDWYRVSPDEPEWKTTSK